MIANVQWWQCSVGKGRGAPAWLPTPALTQFFFLKKRQGWFCYFSHSQNSQQREFLSGYFCNELNLNFINFSNSYSISLCRHSKVVLSETYRRYFLAHHLHCDTFDFLSPASDILLAKWCLNLLLACNLWITSSLCNIIFLYWFSKPCKDLMDFNSILPLVIYGVQILSLVARPLACSLSAKSPALTSWGH